MSGLTLVIGIMFAASHPARNVIGRIKTISSKIQEYRAKGEIEKINALMMKRNVNKSIPYYTIEGRVYDVNNDPIIAGCYVYVYDAYSGYVIKTLYPDINGEFIDTLPQGAYILEAQGDMYPTFYYTSSGGTERIENAEIVWLNQNTDSLNLHIPAGNVIMGKLYDDSTGLPIANAYGSATIIDTLSKTAIWKPLSTNDSGQYVIEGVNRGALKIKYYVTYYENTFYGNTTNWFDASVLTFTAWGDTLDSIDVNLVPTGGGTVTGTGVITGLLLTDSGDTVKDPWPYVGVFDANTDAYVYAPFDYDTSTGIYTISELPTGSYKVRIDPKNYLPQFYNDKDSIQVADPISVTDGDTTFNINFNFHRGGAISGTITGTDGYGYTGAYYLDVYDSHTGDLVYGQFGSTPDGNFTTGTDLPTGVYKAYMYPTDIEAGQWYKDAHSFETADTILVTAPDTTSGINFDFYGWTGIISGTVANADGDGVKAYIDVYFGDVNEYVTSVTTNDSGTFVVRNLPEGSYVLYIYPYGNDTLYFLYMDQWYDGQDSWESATRINLNQGDSIDLYITLNSGGRIIGSVTDSVTGNKIPSTSYDFSLLMVKNNDNRALLYDLSSFGTYRSDVLFEGSYRIILIPISTYDTTEDIPLKYNPYHFEFYDESQNFSSATQVAVVADSITTCNFNTAKVSGAVEGSVMNGSDPLSGEYYTVIAVNPEGYPVAAFTTSDTSAYHIGGLIPGNYYLYLWPYGLWYNQVYSPINIERVPYNIPSGAQAVTISSSTVSGINFDITGISEHKAKPAASFKMNTIVRGNVLFISEAETVKSITVFDASGREITSLLNRDESKMLKLNLNGARSGIYFVSFDLENGKHLLKKVMILK